MTTRKIYLTAGASTVATVIMALAFFTTLRNNVNAQSAVDPYVLNDRLNRLEEQIFELRQNSGDNRAVRLQPKRFEGDPASAAGLSLRISDIEEQMRALNGKVEEMSFQMRQLTEKFTRFSEDVEFRFQDIKTSRPATRKRRSGNISKRDLKPKILGTIPAGSKAAKTTKLASAQPSTGNPRTDYDRAFGLIKKRQYAGAEAEFSAFLARYPKNALGGNAQYWLGETFFARKQFKKAADAFLRGYTRYRTSAKAPESLLKLGITLARLGQKDAACSAFDEMRVEFPRAPRNTRDRAQNERRRVGC